MELDDDYKFALDNEVNIQNIRRLNGLRSALLQLEANRDKIDWQVFTERRRDLLEEYSLEVDKENGNNTFITAVKYFAKDTTRPIVQDKWTSIFRKRLQEGISPSDIVASLNPKLKLMMELSKQFKNNYKNRIIQVKPISRNVQTTSSDNDNELSSQNLATFNGSSNDEPSNKIANFIQNKMSKYLFLCCIIL